MGWKPTSDQQQFIRRYAKALAAGDVALFAGAGLSREAGHVDWRGLLKEIASELKLDIDRETDLIAVAQYHLNEKRNRSRITQTIVDELSGGKSPTSNHRLIARLPASTLWTTNYDELIERAFEESGKVLDVKRSDQDLAHAQRGRDAVLYKMHGCITQPSHTVLTKDDYERYERGRPLFVESLKGDLVSKTFLFLGFSFTDPNIDYILSRVRVLLGTNVREHYCILRSPKGANPLTGKAKADLEYERRKAQLRREDLLRFGIDTVWIEEFEDVGRLLEALSAFVHRRSVFVSGACVDPSPLGRDKLDEFVREVGGRLIADGYNLVSGFGYGLGEQCVVGALRALYGIPKGADVERLVVRPFPSVTGADQKQLHTRHRQELIARSGVVIVVSGNRTSSTGEVEPSTGVHEEVEIALTQRKFVIPVGATGHAAKAIWELAKTDPDKYLPGIKAGSELKVLGNASATVEQLTRALFSVLAKTEKAAAL